MLVHEIFIVSGNVKIRGGFKLMVQKQIIAFLLVGIANTLFGYFLYAFFLYLGVDYAYSLALATLLGVFFNFQTVGRLVFQSRKNSLVFKFILVYSLVFTINLGFIKGFILLGLNEYASGAIALFPAAALSFLLNKFFVFKR